MIHFQQPTALFGGAFDPVHEGHLHLAKEVLRLVPELQQLAFVPAAQSPGKDEARAPAEERLRWLRLVVEPEGFLVWDTELQRPGESFTVTTLEEAHQLGARREHLYWVLGADAYAQFPHWRSPERIRELCRLLVVQRPGSPFLPLSSEDRMLPILPHSASSTALRAQLAEGNLTVPALPERLKNEWQKLLPLRNPYARKQE